MPDKLKNSQKVDTLHAPPVEKPSSKDPGLPQTPTDTPPPPLPGQPPTPPPAQEEKVSAPPPPPPKPIVVTPRSGSKSKLILSLVVLFFLLASIPAAVYLVKQRQEIRKRAVGPFPCRFCLNERCETSDRPADCDSSLDECEYDWQCQRCYCDKPDPGSLGVCSERCALAGASCWTDSECGARPTPTPTPTPTPPPTPTPTPRPTPTLTPTPRYTSCASWGYREDPGCAADPNCRSPGQDGFCCINDKEAPVCCYRNGECFEGQVGNCEDRGNGCIWLKGGITTTVYKMVENHDVSCPYSSGNRTPVFEEGTVPRDQVFCMAGNECGQIEAIGYCGSCKSTGCGGPPSTPTPTPVYELACKILKVYDENWEKITDLTTIAVGDTVRFLVEGLCTEPRGITKARFRISGGEWLGQTGKKWGKFYLEYAIPTAGSYQIEAMVYNPAIDWK